MVLKEGWSLVRDSITQGNMKGKVSEGKKSALNKGHGGVGCQIVRVFFHLGFHCSLNEGTKLVHFARGSSVCRDLLNLMNT